MRQAQGVATDDLTPTHDVPSSRVIVRRAAGLILLIVVLALVVSVLPGFGEVRARFGRADPMWIVVTFVCALGSTISYVAAVHGTLSGRIAWRSSWALGMAEQGSNVLLPTGGAGGPALGAVVMRRAGVPAEFAAPRSAALFLLTSGTSFAAIALFGLAEGLGILPGDLSWVGTLLPAGLAVVIVGAVAALGALPPGRPSDEHRLLVGWGLRVGALLRDGVQESFALLRARNGLVIAGCIGYLAFDIAALGASFQAFGGDGPTLGLFVLAYTLGQAGALIPTPGGLGGTEGGLIGFLVLYGAPAAPAAAAVLGYRVFQLGLPTIFGVIAFARIRHRLGDEARTAEVAARFSDVAR
jgi:uncharacterized membrane protein YbhN (UPF0104 family)